MKNKGFTLTEILTVMVILSMILIIAVPASQGIAKRINKKMLSSKKSVALKAASFWGQDNLECFEDNLNCSELKNRNEYCQSIFNCKSITLYALAKSGYIQFDNEELQEITNPIEKLV